MLKFSKNESETKEYFFALEIDIDRVKSAIWMIEENQTKLVSFGETQSYQNEEDLLESVDASLSSAIEKFSPDGQMKEPNKVIFGLSTDWIDQNKILPEKAETLKKISQKLELTPLGFMIVPEAIAHWLKKLEGVPPTAILIGLSAKRIVVSLIDLGRIVQTSLVIRSENLGADLAEGLSRLEKDTPFPARILLYDGEEKIEQARQDLINWPWLEEKITFLHLPKVEILSADFDIKAIVLASASQMAEVQGLEVVQEEIKKPQEEPLEVEESKEVEEKEEEVLSVPIGSPIDLLGFIKGGDINEIKPSILNEEPEISQEKTEPDKFLKIKKLASLRKNIFNFSWLKKIIPQGTFRLNRESTLSVRTHLGNKSLLITILASVFFLIILSGLILAYWYLPRASIVIFAKPQILEKDFTVKLDPTKTNVDKGSLTLPGRKVEVSGEGEKEISTTGTKLIGEKARGEIVIYNRTSKEKTFVEGTESIGPSGLKFTLDEKVVVASESAGSDYVKVPGKATVKVTAFSIGSESNLASGSEFTIGNFARTDFIARNESSFSGGTSREVQVVAKNDQEKVLADLEKELKQKATDELASKLSSQEKLVDDSLTSQIVEKTFDKKIDEEANTLKLKLKLKISALSFSEDDFKQLIGEEIQKLVPPDFEYDPEQTETSFQLKESSAKIITFTASFKAKLVPKFNLEEIKNNLAGKKPMIGQTYLGNLSNVESFEAKISPKFPGQIATFPRVANRINIEIKLK
jgi:hypothetical protein